MKAEDKAKELFEKFQKPIDLLHKYPMCFDTAKQCALIAVDEIINSNPCDEGTDRGGNFEWCSNEYYWQEVKKEIELL
jgi:hypothetical protein